MLGMWLREGRVAGHCDEENAEFLPIFFSRPGFVRLVAPAVFGLGCWMGCAGAEEGQLAVVTEEKVAALPEGEAIGGELPRHVLMVQLGERGERIGGEMVSSYWVFDPEEAEKGLRRVFSGPGDDQHLWFMTPLFNGWGVASGGLDAEKEPDRSGPWFWFNLLSGESGPAVEADLSWKWMERGWLVGERTVGRRNGRMIERIARYEPLEGTVKRIGLDFSHVSWLGRTRVLGVAELDAGERVVLLDVESGRYEVMAEVSPGYDDDIGNKWGGYSIQPAGENGRDGIYAIDHFTLWYWPKSGGWHQVVGDVRVVKTFGGAAPGLSVKYVGNGRFAVAKTVKDEAEVPEDWPADERGFGAAEAVTMLIDGVSGEVLRESAPHIYHHNPRPEIPEEWWAAGFKPGLKRKVERASMFRWEAVSGDLSAMLARWREGSDEGTVQNRRRQDRSGACGGGGVRFLRGVGGCLVEDAVWRGA